MEKTNINSTDNKDIFKQEEARANVLTSYAILSISVISILLMGLSLSGLTVNSLNTAFSIAFTCIVIFLAIAAGITGILLKGRYGWLKYLLLIVMLFGVGFNRAIRSYYGLVLCLIPLVLSIRYLSRKFTIIMTVITNIMVTLAQLISVKIGILDLNMIELDPGTVLVIPQGADSLLKTAVRTAGFSEFLYFKNTLIYIIGFNLLEITILGYICSRIAAFAKDMVLRHAEISRREAGVKKELDLAAAIQSNIIPKTFPPFPNRKEFELYALTKPAKEVGGDFYDFFLIDEDHLCLVIADVSGKGVPAALFMMVAKSLIKNRALMGGSPAEIISDVNNQLNDGNVNKMFVTVWFAILSISTGELRKRRPLLQLGRIQLHASTRLRQLSLHAHLQSFLLVGLLPACAELFLHRSLELVQTLRRIHSAVPHLGRRGQVDQFSFQALSIMT